MKCISKSIFTCAALIVLALAYLGRDTAPVHAGLVNADLPPLIPTRDFYASYQAEFNYKPSQDGELLAYASSRLGEQVVRVSRLSDGEILAILSGVSVYFWNTTGNQLLVVSKDRLWSVDPLDAEREQWIDVSPRGFNQWQIARMPETFDASVLVSSSDRNPAFADLYTTRADGGGKRLLIENEGSTLYWIFGPSLVPAARVDRKDDDLRILRHRSNDGAWEPVLEFGVEDIFAPIEVVDSGDALIALTNIDRDKSAIVKIGLKSGAIDLLFSSDDSDIVGVLNFELGDDAVDLVRLQSGFDSLVAITPRGKRFLQLAEASSEPESISLIAQSADGRYVTTAQSRQGESFRYFLYDLIASTKTHIADYHFSKHNPYLADTTIHAVSARDSSIIPIYVSRPVGLKGPGPTVVQVHGGPASHYSWGYDHERQFLANRGYTVIAINFRGSTGYGKSFQRLGFRQFGAAIQDDVLDVVAWAVEQGITDKDAIAIMGASFGGYTSAMAVLRDPGVFKAAVVEHAVLDLPYQQENNPYAWGLSKGFWELYFGDITKEDDRAVQLERSPQSQVARLEAPILLIAGKRDQIVGFEQSEEFERTALSAGKNIKSIYFDNEGHGVSRWQNQFRRARAIEDFLAAHLGGRSGGWDYFEVVVDLLSGDQ